MPKSGSISYTYKTNKKVEFYWIEQSIDRTNKKISIKYEIRNISTGGDAIEYPSAMNSSIEYTIGSYSRYFDFDLRIGSKETKIIDSGSISVAFGNTFKYGFDITGAIATMSKSGSGTVSNPITTLSTLEPAKYTNIIGSTASYTIKNSGSATTSNSNLTHTVKYSFEGTSATIKSGISNTSFTWAIPLDLHNKITNKIESNCTYTVTTYFNGLYLGETTKAGALKVDETKCKPTIAFTTYVSDATSVNLTNSDSVVISGISTIGYAANVTAKYGATIASYKVTNGAQTKTTDSGSFTKATSGDTTITVTDSRGLKTSVTNKLSLIEYFIPTCNLKTNNPSTDGNVTLTINGSCFRGDFGTKTNTITLSYKQKEEGGSYSSWKSVSGVTYSSNTYNATITISGLEYQKGYVFQIRAVDAIKTVYSAEIHAKSMPMFDWGEQDFSFNVPVSIQGNTINNFIVESGTEAMGSNGTWYWYKYADGRAECYGCRNYGNMGVSTAWGNVYVSSRFTQAYPTGLFAGTPSTFITIAATGNDYVGWIATGGTEGLSKDNTAEFQVIRGSSATMQQVYISFHAIGRWKS